MSFVFTSIICLAQIVCIVPLLIPSELNAQPTQAKKETIQSLYVHASAGIGFEAFRSEELEFATPTQYNIQTEGYPFQYGVRLGFRDIVQVEYLTYKTSAHQLKPVNDGGIQPSEIPLELEVSDLLLKVNPFVWTWWRPRFRVPMTSLFLIVGDGNVMYRDAHGDELTGGGLVVGGEIAFLTRYVSGGIGATYQSISFEPGRLAEVPLPIEIEASRVLVYARVGIGFGK